MSGFTIGAIIAKYVALRDEASERSKRHAEELKPFGDKMQAIEAYLLNHLNEQNENSIATEHGTAYRSTIMSATVAEFEPLLDFILMDALERVLTPLEMNAPPAEVMAAFRSSPRFALLNRAVNKTAVAEMMERENGATPPGVRVAHVTKVNIRRT